MKAAIYLITLVLSMLLIVGCGNKVEEKPETIVDSISPDDTPLEINEDEILSGIEENLIDEDEYIEIGEMI